GCGRSAAGRDEDLSPDGACRKECRHRDGAAEDPDRGGQCAAHHQPAVVGPAGNRRNRVVAEAAAKCAAGQLVMLTQRIGKSANEFLTMEGVSPEAVFLLGKDLNSFKEIAQGLLDGSPELRLAGSKDPQTRERLDALMKLYEQTRTQAGAILGNLQGLGSAREAQAVIIADSEPLRRSLEELQAKLSEQTGLGFGALLALAIAAGFAILCSVGLAFVQLQDSRKRQSVAENQRLEAEHQEQEAKRVNDAN